MSSIDRRPHLLRREKSLAIPRHVIFCDTETRFVTDSNGNTTHTLEMGWACYYRRAESQRKDYFDWLFFTTIKQFWTFVGQYTTTKNRLWVITHNLSFDFTVLEGWNALTTADYKLKFFYSNGITTLIKVRGPGKSIIFVDSLNWFKESLAELGERLGIPKLNIDFDTASWSYKKLYCRRDVDILIAAFKSLVAYLQGNHISRLCYTIGSTAMAAFLFSHYRDNIYIHNNREAITLERAAYVGGRTECFYIGELTDGPYYLLDVNSLYPFVMRQNIYPTKYTKIIHNCPLDLLPSLYNKFCLVGEVFIETSKPVYPVKQDRTIFPTGNFGTVLCTPEIIFAHSQGHIKHIGDMVCYENDMIFTTFVDKFYQLRRDFKSAGVPLFEHFTKILMNSLYGKFAQKGEIWHKIGDCPGEPNRIEEIIDVDDNTRRRLRYLLGEVFELTGREETRHSFPAISAHVTAYARLYLWTLMQTAGVGNYFYCDTDSLFVNQTGYDRLSDRLDDDKLGYLKVQAVTPTLTIYGLKDYVTNAKTVTKGIRKNAVRIADGVYRQEVWPSFKSVLKNTTSEHYTTVMQTKALSRNYVKGIITHTGVVVPFRFDAPVEHVGPALG